jgi:hypothetical protein
MSLSNILTRLKLLIEHEPATVFFGLSAALIPVLTQVLHWSTAQTAGAAAILTALSAIAAGFKARPVPVSTIIGGAVAIAEALAVFHVKIAPADLAMFTSSASALLAALLRANLTPVAFLRGGRPGG